MRLRKSMLPALVLAGIAALLAGAAIGEGLLAPGRGGFGRLAVTAGSGVLGKRVARGSAAFEAHLRHGQAAGDRFLAEGGPGAFERRAKPLGGRAESHFQLAVHPVDLDVELAAAIERAQALGMTLAAIARADGVMVFAGALEHRAKKWTPVFRKNDAKTKESRANCDSTESQLALGGILSVRHRPKVKAKPATTNKNP